MKQRHFAGGRRFDPEFMTSGTKQANWVLRDGGGHGLRRLIALGPSRFAMWTHEDVLMAAALSLAIVLVLSLLWIVGHG